MLNAMQDLSYRFEPYLHCSYRQPSRFDMVNSMQHIMHQFTCVHSLVQQCH